MRLHVAARKVHKWLGFFVGLQVVLWSLSGLYMTAVRIDVIHGDHFIRPAAVNRATVAQLADPLAVAKKNGATTARLTWLRGRPIYVLLTETGEKIADAVTGNGVAPPSEAEIRSLAKARYSGRESIASVALISEIPAEIRGRKPPLWRVEFDHWNRPTLYLSPTSGELVTRRHELWRIFDFVWMFHIMDFAERENVNNPLLRIFTWGGLLMASSGIWLLFYSFHRRRGKRRGNDD